MASFPFLVRRSAGAQRRCLRQRHSRQQQRGRLGLGLFGFRSGVPFDARLYHQVDGIAVLDVVLLQQLGVRQRFALQEEPLRRGWRGAGLRGDLGLEGRYGIRWGYGYGDGERGLEGLECDLDGGGR